MAKSRIGHIIEAEILQAIGVDYIDEYVAQLQSDLLRETKLTHVLVLRVQV
jgi:pyridoxal biosynthesis lyase PdxS